MATPQGLYNIDGQTYQMQNSGGYTDPKFSQALYRAKTQTNNGKLWTNGATYLPYNGSIGNGQQPRPQTPYTPNAFTQAQLAQFNNGQRGNFENNPAYQQYVAKMNNMYGVSPVGAAGDVLDGQTAFNAGIGGKSAPTTGGSNV